MPNQKNIDQVAVLAEKLGRAKAVYFTDYQGLDVANITVLRRRFTEEAVEFRVAKNTLIKIAAEKSNLPALNETVLAGPTALAIAYEEPTTPAKIIKEFTKTLEKPEVKGILFEGSLLDKEAFDKIANLPSREVLLGQLVGLLQSPLTKLVRTLSGSMTKLVGVLDSLREEKSKT